MKIIDRFPLCLSVTLFSIFFTQLIVQAETPLSWSDKAEFLAEKGEEKPEKPGYRSYIGIQGNIGIRGDDSAISDGGYGLIGKTGFNENLSLHTSTIFGNTISTYALTYGVPIANKEDEIVAFPFIGPGLSLTTTDGIDIDFLITAGVDVPLSPDFTGTIRLNTNFKGDPEMGILLGIGYNFSLLDLLK